LSSAPGEPRQKNPFVHYWLPVLGYIGLIITLSAQPNLKAPLVYYNGDKVAHVLEYFGLGFLIARAIRHTLRLRDVLKPVLLALVLGVAIGAGDETFQRLIPGRDSSIYDLFADCIGLLIAQVAYLTFAKD